MGLFRKVTSVSTLGMVKSRNPTERTAHNTKKSAKYNKKAAKAAKRRR